MFTFFLINHIHFISRCVLCASNAVLSIIHHCLLGLFAHLPVEKKQHVLFRYVLKHGSWSCAGPLLITSGFKLILS